MLQKQKGKQPGTSDGTQEIENPPGTIETSSVESIGVPAIDFEKYIGTTGVRYIQMGQVNHIQNETEWDLEETIRQAEQNFTTVMKPMPQKQPMTKSY